MVSLKGTHCPPEVILPCVRWLEETLHRRKRPVWISWRLDETSLKVQGQWRELSRAVEKHGQTMDFLLTAPREKAAALRCLKKAMGRPGVPEQLTLDGSEANASALKSDNDLRQNPQQSNVFCRSHSLR